MADHDLQDTGRRRRPNPRSAPTRSPGRTTAETARGTGAAPQPLSRLLVMSTRRKHTDLQMWMLRLREGATRGAGEALSSHASCPPCGV